MCTNNKTLTKRMFFLTSCFLVIFKSSTSEKTPPALLTLEDLEFFIHETVNKNDTFVKLFNPTIHTKKGLEELLACVNSVVSDHKECNHPALVGIDEDLTRWVEHGVSVKYGSYEQKLESIYKEVYHTNPNQRLHFDAYNVYTKILFYYLVNSLNIKMYNNSIEPY